MKKLKFLPYKRKNSGRTNYKKRLLLLKSKKTRLVVRKTNKNIIVQFVNFDPKGDRVVFQANSHELIKKGWPFSRKNIPAAYLTGYMLGKKAAGKIKEAILDLGLHTSVKGCKIYACMKGVIDAGITVRCDEGFLPKQDRLEGKHIMHYHSINKNKAQFCAYKDTDKMNQIIDQTKKKL